MNRLFIVLATGAAALAWQFTTVQVNYQGNWTALFCTAGNRSLPPRLASEKIFTFPGSNGFDGQFYHYVAHEPAPGELSEYVDAPRMRYRRILVPGLAWLLAMGRPAAIDAGYLAVGYGFLLLGLWWTASCARQAGLGEQWGLLFAALPASLVFVDRLTIDHALAALAVAFVILARRGPSWRLYLVLALAPLARETGLLLTTAWAAHCALGRRWRETALAVSTAIPWLAWSFYLMAATPPTTLSVSLIPLSECWRSLAHPVPYPPGIPLLWAVRIADVLALGGMLAAIGLAGALAWRKRRDPAAIAALLFAALALVLQHHEVWVTPYNYGRIFSPLLVLVAMGWLPVNRALAPLPVAMMLPRLLMQYGRQVEGVVRAAIGP